MDPNTHDFDTNGCAGWLESTPAALHWLLGKQPENLKAMAYRFFLLAGNVIFFLGAFGSAAVSEPTFLSFCDKMMTISQAYLQHLRRSSSSSTTTINTAGNAISTNGTAISSSASVACVGELCNIVVLCQYGVLKTISLLPRTSPLLDEHPLLSNLAVAEAAMALTAASCHSAYKQHCSRQHCSRQQEKKKGKRTQRLNQEQGGIGIAGGPTSSSSSIKAVNNSVPASHFSELLLHPDHEELQVVGVKHMIDYDKDKFVRVGAAKEGVWEMLSEVFAVIWGNRVSVLSSNMKDGNKGSSSKDLKGSGNGNNSSGRGGSGSSGGSNSSGGSGRDSGSSGGSGSSSSKDSKTSGNGNNSSSSGRDGGSSKDLKSSGHGNNSSSNNCSSGTSSGGGTCSRDDSRHALVASFPLASGEGLLLLLEQAALLGAKYEDMPDETAMIGVGLCQLAKVMSVATDEAKKLLLTKRGGLLLQVLAIAARTVAAAAAGGGQHESEPGVFEWIRDILWGLSVWLRGGRKRKSCRAFQRQAVMREAVLLAFVHSSL